MTTKTPDDPALMLCTQNTMHMTCQAFTHDEFRLGVRWVAPALLPVTQWESLKGMTGWAAPVMWAPQKALGPSIPHAPSSRTYALCKSSQRTSHLPAVSTASVHFEFAHQRLPAFHREAGSAFCRKRHKRHLLNSWLVAERFCHAA